MLEFISLQTEIAWAAALLLAWLTAEYGYLKFKLPRISTYAVVGFVCGPAQLGLLADATSETPLLLANIAFGLLLFECGYRIHLRWLITNPWVGAAIVTEALLTFIAVYGAASWMNQSTTTSLLLATLSMATSPATVVRVIAELRSSGQVTERVLHHAVFNSGLAVLAFKFLLGLLVFNTSGSLLEATYSSLFVLAASVSLGALLGWVVPAFLRLTHRVHRDSTLAFTIAILFLVALAHALKLSPVLAALTFGVAARHRRIIMSPSQQGFGALGDCLSVFLFVFIASKLDASHVMSGIGLGLLIISVRLLAKVMGSVALAHISGISLKKGALIGMACAPFSAFVSLVLEQTRHLGLSLVDQLAPLAMAALVLEILGPLFVQRALMWAHEIPDTKE
jgi:Kef-type K+ transport system membrane component KefB